MGLDEYTTVEELINKVTEYRELSKTYKNNKSLNSKDGVITLINVIIHEALELHETTLFKDEDEIFDSYKEIKRELADVMIYCIALADYLEEPLVPLINSKIDYNIKRHRLYSYPRSNYSRWSLEGIILSDIYNEEGSSKKEKDIINDNLENGTKENILLALNNLVKRDLLLKMDSVYDEDNVYYYITQFKYGHYEMI